MRRVPNLLFAAGLTVYASAAAAETIHVPGDYPTISQALAAANPGDAVAVGPGTWAEGAEIEIPVGLRLYSTAGPGATVLDGQNAHRILRVAIDADVAVSGFTFANGLGVPATPAAGAIIVGLGARLTLEDCDFRDCFAEHAGAIYVSGGNIYPSTRLVARRCRFEGNRSEITGGAVYVVLGASAVFSQCQLVENDTETYAGAVHAHRAAMDFERCLFRGNRSDDVAGALYYGTEASGSVLHCTFLDQESPGPIAGTIVAGSATEISGNVFVGEISGYAVRWYTGVGLHECNVYWNNVANMAGAFLGASEREADPLFCDPSSGNLRVRSDSPLLPQNSGGCGLIGAFGEGCRGRVLSVEARSWGAIKAGYRKE